jgi:hypothetical protein
MKPFFHIMNRNKERFVGRSVAGALAQTVPCDILISDQGSTDKSLVEIQKAIFTAPRGAEHTVRTMQCPIEGPYGMWCANAHTEWGLQFANAEWIFHSSADDYSLPDRVKVCMEAVEKNPCSAVACTMFYQTPGEAEPNGVSGFSESGYVKAGEGLFQLTYGSTIAGYSREFLMKIGSAGRHTPDVYWGYLAALENGFYVVANPQHVHVNHADAQNTGFQGKLRGATGDELARLNELNHFQLFSLYIAIADRAQQLHPEGVAAEDWIPLMNTCILQAKAWSERRQELHEQGVTPGVL